MTTMMMIPQPIPPSSLNDSTVAHTQPDKQLSAALAPVQLATIPQMKNTHESIDYDDLFSSRF